VSQPEISVVIPVFNEADNLNALCSRLISVLDGIDRPYEIIFTNDGSRDDSFSILKALHQRHPREIRVIDFNANFGQHMAIMAAFERVRGDIVVTLDADLQNPPEEIPKLVNVMEAGHDVVGGYRKQRQDNMFRRYASRIINKIRERTTHIHMRDQGCMLRAYRRNIVDAIVASGESSTFIPALALSYARNPAEVEVEHAARAAGESKYRLYDLIRLNFDLMTGFSLVPLQVFTLFGIVVAAMSGLLVFYLMLRRLLIGPEVEGVFTLFGILYFLLGVAIFGLGIAGEYIGRIYLEVRHRPRFVIREVVEDIEPAPDKLPQGRRVG
jgi:undecaprenyl-phosphate 4-deoxy-4-formamido-L-arabinose transferase